MKLSVKELCLFSMLGTLMYTSKVLLEFLPNVHLLATFTIAYTLHFRKKALYPIYIYVFILALFNGFSLWVLPHLYLWTILWGCVMLIPTHYSQVKTQIICTILCGLHGFLYGTLYTPAQALLFGLSFKGMITWIIAGLPWDLVHGISNLCVSILITPLTKIFKQIHT